MTIRASAWVGIGAVSVLLGCARGSEDPREFTLESGEYQLSTIRVEGSCDLKDAITPGGEFVGKLGRVEVDASTEGARFQACDDFFPDTCMPALEASFQFSVIRDEDELKSQDPGWRVPFCWCSEVTGTRNLQGLMIEDDTAELTWTFDIPASSPECGCAGWDACTATVEQRLVPR